MNLKATTAISRFSMLNKGDSVLVGVSGGADSMALLHFLCSLRDTMNLHIYAAHVNHGLRGDEARRDETFVRRTCREWQVELFVLNADVKAEAALTGETVEEAGRRIRYDFFERKASDVQAKIATAHTLSDCMETMLINLARGTGLKGLCGIPAKRGRIIRPLIESTRRDVEEYCKKNAIEYVNDSTNYLRDFTRNKIRLDVIPLLYKINPSLDQAMLRAIRNLSEDESILSEMAEQISKKVCKSVNKWDTDRLKSYPDAMVRRVLILIIREATGVQQEARNIRDVFELIQRGGGRVQIKGGFIAEHLKKTLSFYRTAELIPEEESGFPLREGTYKFGCIQLDITFISRKSQKNFCFFEKQYFKNMIDCDRIIGKAVIRSKTAGEKFTPAGRGIRKSIKKLFNEAAIPFEERSKIPLISDAEGIVWIDGFGPDERCRVTDQTQTACLIMCRGQGG